MDKPINKCVFGVVINRCEPWFLTLREEYKLRLFENMILSEYLVPRGMRMGSGEGSTMRNLIVYTVRQIYSKCLNLEN